MRDVFRSPLRVSPRRASDARKGLAGARPLLALGLALLFALAPLAGLVRAQGAATPGKPQYQQIEDGPTYVLYQTPSGETGCRAATPAEIENIRRGGGDEGAGLRQINHLGGKGAAGTNASAGLIILLRGTAQLEANAAAKAAFIAAAAKWESIISSPITVTIDVDYGTTFFGTAYSSANTLGATSSGGFLVDYSRVRQQLINRAPAGSEEAALLGSLPASSLPTDIGSIPSVFVPPSVMRALGLSFNESTAPVPRIGFNSNFAFDFDPSNGVTFNQTDFDSVAVHEIGHALGFNSQVGARELDSTRPLMATVWDFYRFRPGVGNPGSFSAAQRVMTSGTTAADPHVHFSSGPELALSPRQRQLRQRAAARRLRRPRDRHQLRRDERGGRAEPRRGRQPRRQVRLVPLDGPFERPGDLHHRPERVRRPQHLRHPARRLHRVERGRAHVRRQERRQRHRRLNQRRPVQRRRRHDLLHRRGRLQRRRRRGRAELEPHRHGPARRRRHPILRGRLRLLRDRHVGRARPDALRQFGRDRRGRCAHRG
ncbi:MAG: NF038122 family metalloprotease [Acidobacteria bacterium]|nr:NF038122 family metalloprotease [Acidobacteriota bacterium]